MFTPEESQFLNNMLGNLTITALHPDAANTVTLVNSIARKLARIQEATNKAIAEAQAKAKALIAEQKKEDDNSIPAERIPE